MLTRQAGRWSSIDRPAQVAPRFDAHLGCRTRSIPPLRGSVVVVVQLAWVRRPKQKFPPDSHAQHRPASSNKVSALAGAGRPPASQLGAAAARTHETVSRLGQSQQSHRPARRGCG